MLCSFMKGKKCLFPFLGLEVIPWLGNFTKLGPIDPNMLPSDSENPFPVKPTEKRSYAQNCVVWIKQSGLQVNKILILSMY